MGHIFGIEAADDPVVVRDQVLGAVFIVATIACALAVIQKQQTTGTIVLAVISGTITAICLVAVRYRWALLAGLCGFVFLQAGLNTILTRRLSAALVAAVGLVLACIFAAIQKMRE